MMECASELVGTYASQHKTFDAHMMKNSIAYIHGLTETMKQAPWSSAEVEWAFPPWNVGLRTKKF